MLKIGEKKVKKKCKFFYLFILWQKLRIKIKYNKIYLKFYRYSNTNIYIYKRRVKIEKEGMFGNCFRK